MALKFCLRGIALKREEEAATQTEDAAKRRKINMTPEETRAASFAQIAYKYHISSCYKCRTSPEPGE
jgi:hypothetical protein